MTKLVLGTSGATGKLLDDLLIAPCGMNCGICYGHLREKNNCPGCRYLKEEMPVSIARCKIRNCELIKNKKAEYCFECNDYSCKRLKSLDLRYRTKYKMSEIANLEFIKKEGIEKFVEHEKVRWTCPECHGTVNVHSGACSGCGKYRDC
jgi:hypothetical protein